MQCRLTAEMLEAIRQDREVEKLSLREIAAKWGMAKGTVQRAFNLLGFTRMHPRVQPPKVRPPKAQRVRVADHLQSSLVETANWTTQRKGIVAETAVLFRLAVLGHRVFRSAFEGDRTDLMVVLDSGKTLHLQVKWAACHPQGGRPLVPLRRSTGDIKGKTRYVEGEFDILVGYVHGEEAAYVYTQAELAGHKSVVSTSVAAREAWHKLVQ